MRLHDCAGEPDNLPSPRHPQVFQGTFVKCCLTSYFQFRATSVPSFSLSHSAPLLSLCLLAHARPLCLSAVVPAWLRPHAQPSLSVVKIILIYNGRHYKHVRKQRHGDGAQTKSQCGTVFIRSASSAESALQCVCTLWSEAACACGQRRSWLACAHLQNVCAFVHVQVYGDCICVWCVCVCVCGQWHCGQSINNNQMLMTDP